MTGDPTTTRARRTQEATAVAESSVQWSVVVPLHDEADNVAPLVAELRSVLSTLDGPYEVLLVDDGSRDDTRTIAQRVSLEWPQCRVVGFRRNQGQAAALLVGMQLARGRVIVTLDGDGQNVPADIPAMLAALEGADLVVGVRQARDDSRLRLAMSRLALACAVAVTSAAVGALAAKQDDSVPDRDHRMAP